MKNPYQDEQFITSVDIYMLSDGLRYGYKVFRELIAQQKKVVTALAEIHEEESEGNKKYFSKTFKTSKHEIDLLPQSLLSKAGFTHNNFVGRKATSKNRIKICLSLLGGLQKSADKIGACKPALILHYFVYMRILCVEDRNYT